MIKSILRIRERVLENFAEIPGGYWVVGFSGGKDSSLLVDLLVEYLHRNIHLRKDIEKVFVLYSDTLLEYPPLREYAYEVIEALNVFSRNELNGLLKAIVLKPKTGEDYFSLCFNRGYPAPHRRFRWCTDRFKIRPVKEFLRKIKGEIIIINGSRLEESTNRAKSLKKYAVKLKYRTFGETTSEQAPLFAVKSRGFGVNAIVYSPIAYLKEDEVWLLLAASKRYYDKSKDYSILLKLYGVKVDLNKGKVRRKGVRFGCWLCTVASKDKSGNHLVLLDPKIRLLVTTRRLLMEISHDHNLKPYFREKDPRRKGGYSRLNIYGRSLVTILLSYIIVHYPDALKSYLIYEDLKKSLIEILGYFISKEGVLYEALQMYRRVHNSLKGDLKGKDQDNILLSISFKNVKYINCLLQKALYILRSRNEITY